MAHTKQLLKTVQAAIHLKLAESELSPAKKEMLPQPR